MASESRVEADRRVSRSDCGKPRSWAVAGEGGVFRRPSSSLPKRHRHSGSATAAGGLCSRRRPTRAVGPVVRSVSACLSLLRPQLHRPERRGGSAQRGGTGAVAIGVGVPLRPARRETRIVLGAADDEAACGQAGEIDVEERERAAFSGVMSCPPRLAREAGLSRLRFFDRFRGEVGLAPMEYLTAWRMALAKTLLLRREGSTEEVARRVGYGSASAFSVAFARSSACRPAPSPRSGARGDEGAGDASCRAKPHGADAGRPLSGVARQCVSSSLSTSMVTRAPPRDQS